MIIVINHQKSKCFTIAGRITRVAGSKENFVGVVLCQQQINVLLEGAKWLAVGSF